MVEIVIVLGGLISILFILLIIFALVIIFLVNYKNNLKAELKREVLIELTYNLFKDNKDYFCVEDNESKS